MASRGLVGFFDILGYQNIIDNNTIDDVSKIIRDVLIKPPDSVRKEMSKPFKDTELFEHFNEIIKGVEARLISDSILLVFPVNVKLDAMRKLLSFMLFTKYVSDLLTLTFRNGLPIRGAMDFGEFFLEGHCFAGKPIIDCYRLGSSLDFSGCVMTPGCRDALSAILAKATDFKTDLDSFGFDYLCPCKGESYKRLLLVKWFDNINKIGDLRQAVFEAFKAHNKDIGPGVERKITNTELSLRFLKQKAVAKKQSSRKQKKSQQPPERDN